VRRKGHFVQVWQSSGTGWPVLTFVRPGKYWWQQSFSFYTTGPNPGWKTVRREGLNRKEAVKLAKEIHREGLDSRVKHVTNSGSTITDQFLKE
jgi:hypothetical protein